MNTRFRIASIRLGRALAAMLALSLGAAVLLIVMQPPGLVPLLGAALIPVVILLAWRIWRRAGHLNLHAQQQSHAVGEMEKHYFHVLRQVVVALEARNRYTAGRSDRISRLASQIAQRLDLPAERTELLAMIAQVHDIGLLSVPESILGKPAGLSGPEYAAVKAHCETGQQMLRPLTFLHPALPALRHHHERMNGTGYPDGLSGENIPIEARILAVADSFDAMTHDRPHRPALTHRQAVAELVRCAGNGYDSNCVNALAEITNLTAAAEPQQVQPETAKQDGK